MQKYLVKSAYKRLILSHHKNLNAGDYLIDDRLRISAELSEISEGNVIWANKYDRVKEDIFDIQDEIVRKITIALIGEIELSSLERKSVIFALYILQKEKYNKKN